MRRLDPTLELVACGSSNSRMETFASWEAIVLAECYEAVDHVSLHNYYDPHAGDLGDFLASGTDLDRAISAIVSTADHVGARLGSRRRLKVAVDEWNVWYQSRFHGEDSTGLGRAPAVDRGHLRRGRRGGRGEPADHPAAERRSRRHRLPGPAGQRDRPDPDDARGVGLATDDLPPVRPGRGTGPGRGPAGRAARAGVRLATARRRAPARRHRDVRRGERGGDRLRGEPVARRRPRSRGRPARPRPACGWRVPRPWPAPTGTSVPPTPRNGRTPSGREPTPVPGWSPVT